MEEKLLITPAKADALGIGVFRASSAGKRLIFASNSLARILGYESTEGLKRLEFDGLFLNAEERKDFFKALRKYGKVFLRTALKGGKEKIASVVINAARINSKGRQAIEGVIIEDISLRKSVKEETTLESDFLQELLDNIPDAVYFKDRHNRIIKVNKFYVRGLKLKARDIIGKTDYDFFPKDQADKMAADDNYVLRTGKPIVGKIERTLLPNGSWNQVITTKIPMYNRAGKIMGTMGITRDMTAYANIEKERLTMLISALTVLVKALEMRDPYTFRHVRHVANIAERIAAALGSDEDRVLAIKLAGELHDLGKIGIPLEILNKPGKLSALEYSLVQEHVQKCYDLIKDIKFPFSLADIIYQHHERLDGSGYPRRLSRKGILLEARILAVSDVLESMTCHRPYRETLGIKKAVEELKKGCDRKYDRRVVKAALGLIKENNGKAFWLDS